MKLSEYGFDNGLGGSLSLHLTGTISNDVVEGFKSVPIPVLSGLPQSSYISASL
jgi:hypothetical protein